MRTRQLGRQRIGWIKVENRKGEASVWTRKPVGCKQRKQMTVNEWRIGGGTDNVLKSEVNSRVDLQCGLWIGWRT